MNTAAVENHDPRSIVRTVLIVLLIAQVGIVYVVLGPFSINRRSPPNTPIAVTAPSQTVPLTLESGEVTATTIARSWQDDARLVSAVMQVDWPTKLPIDEMIEVPPGGWIIYTFRTEQSTLSVMLDRKSGAFITSATGESGEEVWPPLELQGYARSSMTALLTADVLEGSMYRNACPASRTSALVTLSTAPDESGEARAVWTVTYGDARYPNTFDVLVRLDAESGNVVTSEREEIACEGNVISYQSSSPPKRS